MAAVVAASALSDIASEVGYSLEDFGGEVAEVAGEAFSFPERRFTPQHNLKMRWLEWPGHLASRVKKTNRLALQVRLQCEVSVDTRKLHT